MSYLSKFHWYSDFFTLIVNFLNWIFFVLVSVDSVLYNLTKWVKMFFAEIWRTFIVHVRKRRYITQLAVRRHAYEVIFQTLHRCFTVEMTWLTNSIRFKLLRMNYHTNKGQNDFIDSAYKDWFVRQKSLPYVLVQPLQKLMC